MTNRSIKVSGMSCGHCKARVEGALKELAGVDSAAVDLEQGTVEVEFDETRLAPADLNAAISEAGYEPVA